MNTPTEKFSREIEPSKTINLFGLDKNIAHLISGYLTNKDLVNLCVTSKGFYSIFYPSFENRRMSYFLKYVVEGSLDKVEGILNKNQKLILFHGDVTDLSGRAFKRITAFQYAAWALDKEMWELILRYLPETDAYEQLRVFEHERHDITKIHGTRLNFAPLLEAYQKYSDNYRYWNDSQLEVCWCQEVGGAQRQMPAWFVYSFCEKGEDTWAANVFKKGFTREPKYLRWWFEGDEYGGKLGVKWAAVRYISSRGVGVGVAVGRHVERPLAGLDRQHLHLCWEERTSCRDLLSNYLKHAVATKSPSPTLNNSRK